MNTLATGTHCFLPPINNGIFIFFISLSFLVLGSSCKKGFLEVKPDKSILVPQTFTDLQSMLDNTAVMNITPALQVISADEFYTESAIWATFINPSERNSYIWQDDLYEGRTIGDWNTPYRQIFYANIVLGQLSEIEKINQDPRISAMRGAALFYRAFAYSQLVQLFCPQYISATAKSELGLPLRLSADVNERPQRSNLSQTYDQILNDLKDSRQLLPERVAYKSRPSKQAAYALMARVYQTMGEHDLASEAAEQALRLNSKLIDFNSLTANLQDESNPFPAVLPYGNEEVIYYAGSLGYSFLGRNIFVEKEIMDSYGLDDLRKPLYFFDWKNGKFTLKGHYGGSTGNFFGLAIDELYLIKAESAARAGEIGITLSTLNSLLVKRYKTGKFINYSINNISELLGVVLLERKKTLIQRGLRWSDLKRLNLDAATQTTITRILNGRSFVLSPNDLKYTFPIPDDEINAGGLEQNKR